MSDQEKIEAQQQLLDAHRRTLSIYLKQRAILGEAYVPPGVIHGIRDAREGIRRTKENLRNWGVLIADDPDDMESTIQPNDPGSSLHTTLQIKVEDWFNLDLAQLNRDLFALVRGRTTPPENLEVKIIAPKINELQNHLLDQSMRQTDPKIISDQLGVVNDTVDYIQRTENFVPKIITNLTKFYSTADTIKACYYSCLLQLVYVTHRLGLYQLSREKVLFEHPDRDIGSGLIPVLAQFVYGRGNLIDISITSDEYGESPQKFATAYVPVERIENDNLGNLIANLYESAKYIPKDIWVEFIVPQVVTENIRGISSFCPWTPENVFYVSEGKLWQGTTLVLARHSDIHGIHFLIHNQGRLKDDSKSED